MAKDKVAMLRLLSDASSLEIFSHIACSCQSGKVDGISVPITKTKLSRRQYYKRLSELIESGLITRINHENYVVTTYGMLVYHQLLSLENIVDHQSKIHAVDSIRMAISNNLNTYDQFVKILSTLIDDHEIRELLIKFHSSETRYRPQLSQAEQRLVHTNIS
jgi:predicted transcriptional regulator